MPLITLLTNDWSVNATATSTNEETDAPADRMLNRSPSNAWRTTNLSAMRATIDAGSSLPWDAVFLGYTNATAAATLRITADDNSANLFTTPDHDSTAFTLRLGGLGRRTSWHAWYELSSTVSHRYIGLEVVDSGNLDGYFRAGIFYAGLLTTPTYWAEFPSEGVNDQSVSFRTRDGEQRTRRKAKKSPLTLEWDNLPESDLATMKDIFRNFGTSEPIVVRRHYENPNFDQDGLIHGKVRGNLDTAIQQTNADGSGAVRFRVLEI